MATTVKVTNKGVAMAADRLQGTPATYTTPPKWVGLGTGSHTAAVTDTALTTPVAEARVAGTESIVTTTVTGDTYQTVATITAGGARVVIEAGTFDALTTGNMGVSATFDAINLASGDSLQLTVKTQFTTS